LPPPPAPPIGGSGPCGTTICEAAWRRISCSSFTVRSIASFASWPNFSAASSSEPAAISKPIGSAPAGVSTCVSPAYSTGRAASRVPSLVTGVSLRIVPMRRSVKTSSR
jgi:hypothetical protein